MADQQDPPEADASASNPAEASQPPSPPDAPTEANAPSTPDVEELLNKAERALESIDESADASPGVKNFEFEDFTGGKIDSDTVTLDLMRDVQLDLTIELGRTHMKLEDVLRLKQGAVVPLDKLAGDPADIYANGRLVARGEVLVLNDNFCVRVAELIEGDQGGD